jgi:hypothetical protein
MFEGVRLDEPMIGGFQLKLKGVFRHDLQPLMSRNLALGAFLLPAAHAGENRSTFVQ